MIRAFKISIALFSAFVALFFLAAMLSIFTELSDGLSIALSLPVSFITGWYVWKSTAGERMGVGFAMLSGALIIGGLGLSIGFLGPAIFDPSANQGPMLGIFITGPLGFVLGAIGGFIY
jgi:hypothetical protein